MEAASIVASTLDFVGSPSAWLRTPVTLEKCPFTLAIIMCLTLNSAVACAGSMFQVVVVVCGIVNVLIFRPSFPACWPCPVHIDALRRYSLQQIIETKKSL